MIPNAQKLFNNFGLDFDEVKTNANADQLKVVDDAIVRNGKKYDAKINCIDLWKIRKSRCNK